MTSTHFKVPQLQKGAYLIKKCVLVLLLASVYYNLTEHGSEFAQGGRTNGSEELGFLECADACRRVQNSKVGNVFTDRLADLWVCEMEAYRDYDKFQKCARCELKPWCRGCPAVASGATGDFYAPDPQCWKTKNDITGEVL